MTPVAPLADRLTESRRLRAEARAQADPEPPVPTLAGWTIKVTCLNCNGPVHHVTASKEHGLRSTAITRCTRCNREWQAVIILSSASDRTRGRQVP